MELSVATYDSAEVQRRGVVKAKHGDDSAVWAEFYNKPQKLEFESEQRGRPIYKDVAYLLITFPGDRTKTWDQPVKMTGDHNGPSDPERFPHQWAAFQKQQEQVPSGTPITEFPAFGRARVMELKAMNIHTVEQYAAVPDGQIESLGLGARKERDKCQAYLNTSVSMSQISSLESENESLKAEIASLHQKFNDLVSRLPTGDDQPAVRRGRPPNKAIGE